MGKAVRRLEDQNEDNQTSKWKQKKAWRQSPATIEWQAKRGKIYFIVAKVDPKSNNCNTSI